MNTVSSLEWLDRLRRLQGRALDYLGLGPQESPYELVLAGPGLRLRRYATGAPGAAPMLIVPAPIKRPYIWDLSPERSVVRRAIEHKAAVFMVEWTAPGSDAPGLADYAGPMLDACVAAIADLSAGKKPVLAGHSLGGVFAALHSAYRPDQVGGLALIDVPLHFPAAGRAPLAPHAPHRWSWPPVSGSFLSLSSAGASPRTFYTDRFRDRMASTASRELMATHWKVERWTLDELPMSRKLYDDVLGRLYSQDSFMRGELEIGGKRLHPSQIKAPLLSVYQPSSALIPAHAVLAFHHAAGSADKQLLPYRGDVGVALQHVGPLVGDNAFLQLWPRIFQWLDRISGTSH